MVFVPNTVCKLVPNGMKYSLNTFIKKYIWKDYVCCELKSGLLSMDVQLYVIPFAKYD